MNNLKYIFVHGLSGWGSYDEQYERMPYWGMRGGDLIKKLRNEGYDCYSASVSPHGSAYDRACELYGQLVGKRSDYGKHHSERHGHERFGRDFTGKPLIEELNEDTRLVIIGHSFGGATIRMFAHIMAEGVKEEQNYDCSDFFKGSKGSNIFALVTIAAPHNGTTAYDLYQDPDFDPSKVRTTLIEKVAGKMMSRNNSSGAEKLPYDDCAAYDMHIDNALRLNERLKLNENTYYFSQPCNGTVRKGNDYVPRKDMEVMFSRTSRIMGCYSGQTREGFILGEDWKMNDGLVNTISSTYPFFNEHKDFDENKIEKGVWNVFETYEGDHMSLQGGLMHNHDILPYYEKLIKMIEKLK